MEESMGNPNMMPQAGWSSQRPSGGQMPGQASPSGQPPYAQQPYRPYAQGSYGQQPQMPQQVGQPQPGASAVPAAPAARPGSGAYPGSGASSDPAQQALPPYAQTAQRSPWPQQSRGIQQTPSVQHSPWSRQYTQQSGQYGQYGNPGVVAGGVTSAQSQDRRFDLFPNRIISIVFFVAMLLAALLSSFPGGVGASGLRCKLIFGVVMLIVAACGIIYVFVKAVPRLRLAKDTGYGWKVSMSGWTTVVLIVIAMIAGMVMTSFAASDYSTGPVTDTVTFVGDGTFRKSYRSHGIRRSRTTASYYEFQTDSGKTFRISLPSGYEDLMPADLEYGQRVTLTYYPRTRILVPDPAPKIAG
ncbi:hypothetical protein [Bifidobacterium apri]|nr:hypothetical protein [Bifidobacterium apri]